MVAGTGNIAQSGNITTITQSSQNLSLNWQSFNIAKSETVNFVQPSASAIAVNRIFDTNGSQIFGQLHANGQVYLINPNGILFGQGAQVNVGSLVASTLDLNDASLNSAMRSFSGTGTGSIINQATINAARGGYVALLGNTVSNQGTIAAPLGAVALGAGNAVTLNFNGNSLIKMQIDQSVLNSLAENGGLIQADGGLVVMNAGAKDALLASVVNNTGKIQARTVENHEGTIILLGGMTAGTVNVGGTLDASAPNGGNGGFIETSAAHVKITDDVKTTTAAATGTAGHWLIDPVDFTIATTGGDITGANLGSLLASNSITIQTVTGTNSVTNLFGSTGSSGDIHVNDAVSWSVNNTLTLDAWRNININKSITATGTSGKLTLKFGQGATDGVIGGVAATYNVNAPVNLKAGNNFSTQLGSTGSVKNYTVITSLGAQGSTTATDLQGMNGNLDANYVLGSNIDATATSGWNSGAGFAPITHSQTTPDTSYYCTQYGECSNQTQLTPFTGTFDGLGHSISALTIYRPSTENIGLFGRAGTTAQIRNIGLIGGSVIGQGWVGALVGDASGTISNSYATGSVTGTNSYIGGLVGAMHSTTISNSYSTGNVNGGSYAGGLLGYNDVGTIKNGYATGSVSGGTSIGGLVGTNYVGSVTDSHASGSVTGNSQSVGGLAGESSGSVSNSYASGTVQGSNWSGGLLGRNTGTLSNSYATGSVSGTSLVGGLVGNNQGTVSNSYATGSVNGTYYVGGLLGNNNNAVSYSYATGLVVGTDAGSNGGLVGVNDGGVTNSYWNKDLTTNGIGRGSTAGSTGLTTAQMQTAANFTGFNFTSTPSATGNNWVMVDVDGSLNNAGGSFGAMRPMLASEYSTTINNAHQLQLMAMAPTANYTLETNVNAATTGLIGGISTDIWGSSGFVSIGNSTSNFTGTFDGLGHTISNLTQSNALNDSGLFRQIGAAGTVKNLGLTDVTIIKQGYDDNNYLIPFGALTSTNAGRVSNVYSTGTITNSGPNYNAFGGLVGVNTGLISNAYSSVTLSSGMWGTSVGGLVGINSGTISSSYAAGAVTGSGRYVNVGGLVGQNTVGGLIENSYAIGAVTSGGTPDSNAIGGLVGLMSGGAITNAYATGLITATKYGSNYGSGLIGSKTGGSISNSLWNTTTSDRATGSGYSWDSQSGVTGLTSSQMMQMASFSSWNSATPNTIANTGSSGAIWRIYEGHTAPLLTSFMTGLALSDASVAYNGVEQIGTTTALSGISGIAAKGTNAGTYLNSYYSTQQGYDISGGDLTINAAALSAISLSGTRTYDGTVNVAANIFTLSGLVNGQYLTLTGSGTVADKNVGSDKTVTLGSLTLGDGSGGLASNYTFTGGTQTATITKADLSVTAAVATKTYDSTLNASGSASIGTLAGATAGESVLNSGAQAFLDKNAGTGSKTVRASGVTIKDAGGVDVSSNYTINYTDNTTSTITKAQLIYTAAPANFLNGQTPNDLSGTVNGFASGDTLTNSTSGRLTWTTPANANSKPGSYVIDGNGLLASNYSFSQAAPNATALTLAPATPPAPVLNARAQLASIAASPQTSVQPAVLSISPAITVTQTNTIEVASSSTGSTSKPDNVASTNTTMTIGGTGPALQIVNGGMRLPVAMVNVNE